MVEDVETLEDRVDPEAHLVGQIDIHLLGIGIKIIIAAFGLGHDVVDNMPDHVSHAPTTVLGAFLLPERPAAILPLFEELFLDDVAADGLDVDVERIGLTIEFVDGIDLGLIRNERIVKMIDGAGVERVHLLCVDELIVEFVTRTTLLGDRGDP